MACRYCYTHGDASRDMMSIATFRHVASSILSMPDLSSVRLLWHGGEPLIMGLPWFTEAISALAKASHSSRIHITHSIQSNLSLLTEEYLDFFEAHRFHISSSLDGPEHIHNGGRQYPRGQGTFADVYRGLTMIKSRNEVLRNSAPPGERPVQLGGGVVVVMSRLNIFRISELYEFFSNARISIKCNPLINAGRASSHMEDISITAEEYGAALIELFDIWYKDKGRVISIDPLEEIVGNVLSGKPEECTFSGSCRSRFISVGPHGDVYPCGRFDGIPDMRLGNLCENSLHDILNSDSARRLLSRSCETIPQCQMCRYRGICNAGCMHNAYAHEGRVDAPDPYCKGYYMLFTHIDEILDAELNNATGVDAT